MLDRGRLCPVHESFQVTLETPLSPIALYSQCVTTSRAGCQGLEIIWSTGPKSPRAEEVELGVNHNFNSPPVFKFSTLPLPRLSDFSTSFSLRPLDYFSFTEVCNSSARIMASETSRIDFLRFILCRCISRKASGSDNCRDSIKYPFARSTNFLTSRASCISKDFSMSRVCSMATAAWFATAWSVLTSSGEKT